MMGHRRHARAWRVLLAAVTTAGLLASLRTAPATATEPATTRIVHVGGGTLHDTVKPFNFTRFYPDTIDAHRGDVVRFEQPGHWASLHTITFRPEDIDTADDPSLPNGKPRPLVIRSNEDSGPGELAMAEEFHLGSPSLQGCGMVAGSNANGRVPQDPCVLNRANLPVGYEFTEAMVGIGNPREQNTFAVEVDLEPGRYRFVCQYHPTMAGTLEVKDDVVPLRPQTEIDREARAALDADEREASAVYAELQKPRSRQEGDVRVWEVLAGAAIENVAIVSYLPSSLDIAPGDRVEFTATGNEPQTVTFSKDIVGGFFLGGCSDMNSCPAVSPNGITLAAFPWGCEYDDPKHGAPAPPTWRVRSGACDRHVTSGAAGQRVVGLPASGLIEWGFGTITAQQQRALNDDVLTAQTFHNSGVMADAGPAGDQWGVKPDGGRMPSQFHAGFPVAGTFTYSCLIHPDVMKGSVRVQ